MAAAWCNGAGFLPKWKKTQTQTQTQTKNQATIMATS